jgi:2-polyprenyl-6-methoxyphenol hydroxylase-like FAD-dependent oxidoreductase
MNVLISGAGIAGPTLAYWLKRYGFNPTLIEAAPSLRTGGYIVDFWGAGFTVAERMGLLPELMRKGYRVREVRLVGRDGRRVGGFRVDAMAHVLGDRFVSLPRGELSASVFAALDGGVETLFGDHVVGIEHHDCGVKVRFAHAPARDFELVIGAGGLHSGVRNLMFGEESLFEEYLGYKVAAFEAAAYQPRDELVYVSYATPGRQVARFALRDNKTLFLLIVADDDKNVPRGLARQRAYLRRHFADTGWECREVLEAMEKTEELYLDAVTQINMPAWSKERVALIGDAAACPSLLAGEGSSLAMTAAYTLAGELHRADGDYRAAFRRYDRLLRPLMERKQKSARAFAATFAPRSRLGIAFRNLMTGTMSVPLVARLAFARLLKDDFALPAYV